MHGLKTAIPCCVAARVTLALGLALALALGPLFHPAALALALPPPIALSSPSLGLRPPSAPGGMQPHPPGRFACPIPASNKCVAFLI